MRNQFLSLNGPANKHRRVLGLLVGSFGLGVVLAVATYAFAGTSSPSPRQLHEGPLSENLAVFSSDTSSAVPHEIARIAEHQFSRPSSEPDDTLSPGTLQLADGRRLLSGLGSNNADLYAWPTTKGAVCFLLSGAFGTCPDRFTDRLPVGLALGDPDVLGSGEPLVIAGIVPGDVLGVEVKVGAKRYSARLANNGFFHELPSEVQRVDALLIRYENGSSRMIAIPHSNPNN